MPPKGKKAPPKNGGNGGGARFDAEDEAKLEALMAKYEDVNKNTSSSGGKKPQPSTAAGKSSSGKHSSAVAAEGGDNTATSQQAKLNEMLADAPMSDAAKARQEQHASLVAKILAVQGESGVQEALRLEVIKTKKAESEVVQAKKMVNAAAREHDLLANELTKTERLRLTLEAHCKTLESENIRMKEETIKRVEEDKTNRDSIRDKIEGEMNRLSGKLQDEDDNHVKIVEENKVMQVKFDELKGKFDDQFAKYEEDWKMREAQTTLLINKTQAAAKKTDLAQAEYAANQKQLTQYIEGTQSLKGQYDLFSEKLGEFEGAAVQQEDVASITAKQMDTLKERLAEAEKTKNDALERKRTFDHQTTQLRQKAKGMKTKVQAAERAKVQAESKCREAQAKAVKDKENAAAGGK